MTLYNNTAHLGSYLAFDITGNMDVNENGEGTSLKNLVDLALEGAKTTVVDGPFGEQATKTAKVIWRGVGIDIRFTVVIMTGQTQLEAGIS